MRPNDELKASERAARPHIRSADPRNGAAAPGVGFVREAPKPSRGLRFSCGWPLHGGPGLFSRIELPHLFCASRGSMATDHPPRPRRNCDTRAGDHEGWQQGDRGRPYRDRGGWPEGDQGVTGALQVNERHRACALRTDRNPGPPLGGLGGPGFMRRWVVAHRPPTPACVACS